MQIYEVLISYIDDDIDCSIESHCFLDYNKAVEKFKELIKIEKEDIWWIESAYKEFESKKKFPMYIEMYTNIDRIDNINKPIYLIWDIKDCWRGNAHDTIELRIHNVEEFKND